jgi:hypothetical protein
MKGGCPRYVLNADGEAERCGAPLHGRFCAAGHQPHQPLNVQPLPPHPTGHTTRTQETKR